MTVDAGQIAAAKQLIQEAAGLIGAGTKETPIRENFTSYLRSMFPARPTWLSRHIEGGESAIDVIDTGRKRTRFIDNLIDLTTIEYESDLTNATKYRVGEDQVREHCAGLLRRGQDVELIVGILSDTVRWHAFRIDRVDPVAPADLGGNHIHLAPIESIDVSPGGDTDARRLLEFLSRHLGRLEARPLSAQSISKDLGFGSSFCQRHLELLRPSVDNAFAQRPEYAQLISDLWQKPTIGRQEDIPLVPLNHSN